MICSVSSAQLKQVARDRSHTEQLSRYSVALPPTLGSGIQTAVESDEPYQTEWLSFVRDQSWSQEQSMTSQSCWRGDFPNA